MVTCKGCLGVLISAILEEELNNVKRYDVTFATFIRLIRIHSIYNRMEIYNSFKVLAEMDSKD